MDTGGDGWTRPGIEDTPLWTRGTESRGREAAYVTPSVSLQDCRVWVGTRAESRNESDTGVGTWPRRTRVGTSVEAVVDVRGRCGVVLGTRGRSVRAGDTAPTTALSLRRVYIPSV